MTGHVHTWIVSCPHEFQHCCTAWNNRRVCRCGFSEKNRKAHR